MGIFSEEQLERYQRHFVLREIGVSGQKKLLQAKVLVIGAGALGSAALSYLAAAGVGNIGIADYDRVERSNLHRQILHRTHRVGMEKVQSAKEAISEINPDVEVQTYAQRISVENICEVIAPYDFVIDATDRFETKFLINDACVLFQKPYSHAGVVRFAGQTMTYVPGEGPCLRCFLEQIPPKETTVTCAEAGVLGAVTGVLGSIQATEAIKYVLGIGDLLVGRVLQFDGLSMRMSTVRLAETNPECPVCGKEPTIRNLLEHRQAYEVSGCGN